MERGKKIKAVIIILAILLGLSLSALGGILIYNKISDGKTASVEVPDNLITPDAPAGEDSSSGADGDGAAQPAGNSAGKTEKAASIELYNKQPEENSPFAVSNMFPGDSATKYFRVRVSYHGKITVHYNAAVRPGYEKLAEVLKVRVKLLSTGETVYDGGIADMPESITYEMASAKSTVGELYYEITAYLDTSVGNDYQNKDLIADFKWWVEETGNLDDSPKTGDDFNVRLFALLAVCSGAAILLLLVRRRKEEKENG